MTVTEKEEVAALVGVPLRVMDTGLFEVFFVIPEGSVPDEIVQAADAHAPLVVMTAE